MASPALTVAILAGGRAERLGGRDKGLEPLGGRALVEHVVDAVAAMDAGAAFAPDEASSLPAPLLIVANRHPVIYARLAPTIGDALAGFRGPLAGVAAALAACRTPWLLTVPVDCPDPPRDLARRLAGAACRTAAPAVVADDGERAQPLFALYRRTLAASAAAAAEAGRGVRHWQAALGARTVDFADRRRQFRNLNTPDEFAAHAAARRPET